jgi:hypothetical protein
MARINGSSLGQQICTTQHQRGGVRTGCRLQPPIQHASAMDAGSVCVNMYGASAMPLATQVCDDKAWPGFYCPDGSKCTRNDAYYWNCAVRQLPGSFCPSSAAQQPCIVPPCLLLTMAGSQGALLPSSSASLADQSWGAAPV